MNPLVFLFGCIGTRLAFAYLATIYPIYTAFIAALISAGFFYVYFTGSRPTGIETGGKPIWWNKFRPLHGLMYGLFAILSYNSVSYNGYKYAPIVIVLDALIGLGLFIGTRS
jgi:hypothetical protein